MRAVSILIIVLGVVAMTVFGDQALIGIAVAVLAQLVVDALRSGGEPGE